MKSLLAISLLFASVSAGAVTVISLPGAPDPGPATGQTIAIDFDSGLPAGVVITGNGSIVSGNSNMHAVPAGGSTPYFSVPQTGGAGSATLDWSGAFGTAIKSFSFYWGSIDTYNSVELLDAGGQAFYTLAGGAIPPANGNQTAAFSNRRVFFTLAPGEAISGLRFNSSGIAYEIDSIALESAVPEPQTWALLVGGFAMIGLAARRRNATRTAVVAA